MIWHPQTTLSVSVLSNLLYILPDIKLVACLALTRLDADILSKPGDASKVMPKPGLGGRQEIKLPSLGPSNNGTVWIFSIFSC